MTKTPQQIKNEVEKEGLEIMERLRNDVKEGRSFLVDEKDYPSYLNVVDNEVNMAKSKILTEYDKAIKEEYNRIAEEYPEHYWRWQFFGKVLFPDKKLLSKIGDNSEVEK